MLPALVSRYTIKDREERNAARVRELPTRSRRVALAGGMSDA
jgi:hypothetical protein